LSCKLETLRNRPDFLRAASARRQGTGGFLLQARARGDDSPAVRIGFTASKKIGNAVFRNRAKRRLRALAREVMPTRVRPGWDYVLVAKPGATVTRDYADLRRDLESALLSVHRERPR
jgi:ribonuclease P protein component